MSSNVPAIVALTNRAVSAGGEDIRGIKAPVEIPSGLAWLWWTLGAMALGALAWWAWRYWRKKKAAAPAALSLVSPDQRAREKLTEALGLIHQPRPFCILVSDTVRIYLEERFSLKAPERTTEEFLEELQGSALLALDQKQTLGEFLNRCDLVKFARYEPGEPELRALHDAAMRLVDETQPAPLAPPTEAADAAADTASKS